MFKSHRSDIQRGILSRDIWDRIFTAPIRGPRNPPICPIIRVIYRLTGVVFPVRSARVTTTGSLPDQRHLVAHVTAVIVGVMALKVRSYCLEVLVSAKLISHLRRRLTQILKGVNVAIDVSVLTVQCSNELICCRHHLCYVVTLY